MYIYLTFLAGWLPVGINSISAQDTAADAQIRSSLKQVDSEAVALPDSVKAPLE